MFRVSIILPVDWHDGLLKLFTETGEKKRHCQQRGYSEEEAQKIEPAKLAAWLLGRYFVDNDLICLDQGFIEQSAKPTPGPGVERASCSSVVVFWNGPDKGDKCLSDWWETCDMLIVHRNILEEFKGALPKASENSDRLVVGFGDTEPDTKESQALWWIQTDKEASLLEQVDGAVRCCCIGLGEVDDDLPVGVKRVPPSLPPSLKDNLIEVPHHIILVDDHRKEFDKLQKVFQDFTYDDRPPFIHFIHMQPGEINELPRRVADLFFRNSHCKSFTVLLDSYFATVTIDDQLKELEQQYPWLGILVFTNKENCTSETILNAHPIGVKYWYKPWVEGQTDKFFSKFKEVLEVGTIKIDAARKMGLLGEVVAEECGNPITKNRHGRESDSIVTEHIERIKKHLPSAQSKLEKLLHDLQTDYNTDNKNFLMPEDDDTLEITALKIKELTAINTNVSKVYTEKIRKVFGFPNKQGVHLYESIYDKIREDVYKNQLFLPFDELKEVWKKKTGLGYTNCKTRWTEGFLESGVIGCTKKLKEDSSPEPADDSPEDKIIGRSQPMIELKNKIGKVAKTDSTVLIIGDSGTGKELVARALHENSLRKDKLWQVVNCGAIQENLFESEFFGHEKGAFTGADKKKKGFFQKADGGTIFLDEIGELPLSMQSKLLRVLQEKEILPVGGDTTIKVDVRVIAATNRDLSSAVKDKSFREDLYFRLNVVPLSVPPLRERKEDVHELVRYFLEKYNKKNEKSIKPPTPVNMDILNRYSWPGNVRELEHRVERAVILQQTDQPLECSYMASAPEQEEWIKVVQDGHRGGRLERLTRRVVQECFGQENGLKKCVATRLKIYQHELDRIVARFNIDPESLSQ